MYFYCSTQKVNWKIKIQRNIAKSKIAHARYSLRLSAYHAEYIEINRITIILLKLHCIYQHYLV